MNEVKNEQELIIYRVYGHGINQRTKEMSKDDVIKRRAIIRRILINTSFNNKPNDYLDGSRIEHTGYGYILEDPKGYETIIGYKTKKATN